MMSAPVARTSAGRIAFTVAAVPTGMKAGVRISPRIMRMTPVRAAPSVAASRNANLSVMVRAYGRSGAASDTEVVGRFPFAARALISASEDLYEREIGRAHV